MTPDVFVEVGNTRMKWGRLAPDGTMTSLAVDHTPSDWQTARDSWSLPSPISWLVAGVVPKSIEAFAAWAKSHGDSVHVVSRYHELPITLNVESPERVGLDRLLGCIAANRLRQPDVAAMTIDIGTATTVNLVDRAGVFQGGMILPGVQTMLQALHSKTAQLPDLANFPTDSEARFPAKFTTAAMQTGAYYAIAGAARLAIEQMIEQYGVLDVFVTGGGAEVLLPLLQDVPVSLVSTLNLDGLRIVAETLP
ncbi:MAG: type III pantothenate kinase [Fimbriiglobus sp.]